MRRRIARFLVVTLLGTLALVLGTVTAMTLTPPGRALLARTVEELVSRRVAGSVSIGGITGSFVRDLAFKQLIIRDTSGALLADVPRARLSFRLPTIVAGQIVFGKVVLEEPEVHLTKYRNGRMNYEEVFGLTPDTTGGKSRPALVQFFDVEVRNALLRLALPWNPSATLTTRAQRDSALAAERRKPGRLIVLGRDGLQQVITFAELTARLPYVLVSSPDRKPLTARFDTLAVRISDPALTVRDLVGQVEVRGDTLAFQLERAALPGTEAIGGGIVTWPHGPLLYDFRLNVPRVDLTDVRFISPQFPALKGRTSVVAKSENENRTTYTLRDVYLSDGAERIDGNLVAIVDQRRGLGVRDLRLTLGEVNLDQVRAYVDSLPFRGRVSGDLRATGFLDDMQVGFDWIFTDFAVPGRPRSTLAGSGGVGTGGDAGLTFRGLDLTASDIDLGTVRRLAPAVALPGRMQAVGTVDGALRDVTFNGRLTHRDGDLPASAAEGRFRLDTRAKDVVFDVDADLDPLAFDGIRPAFPSLPLQGTLRGHVTLQGPLAQLATTADVTGELGHLRGSGTLVLVAPRFGADSLDFTFEDLNLAALSPKNPSTSLRGRLTGHGAVDTLVAPVGAFALALGPGQVGPFGLDTLDATGGVQDSVVRLDSLVARWAGVRGSGSGTLGWARPHDGRLRFRLEADTLAGLDSVLANRLNMPQDTAVDSRILAGRVRATATVSGSLDSLDVRADASIADAAFRLWRLPTASMTATWSNDSAAALGVSFRADSVREGSRLYTDLAADLDGTASLVNWNARGRSGELTALDARGRFWPKLQPSIVSIDTLSASLGAHTWSLESPVAITLKDSAQAITPLALRTSDGSGRIDIVGRIPGTSEGGLTLGIYGVDLRDVDALIQRDTASASGTVTLIGDLGGTARSPTLRGSIALEDARIGEARLPLVQGAVDYAEKRLDANLLLWRTGEPIFSIEARLPLDLAWLDAGERQVDGPLEVRAHADSADLAILEAITPALRNVKGTLAVDMRVDGTWKQTRVQGSGEIKNGQMTVRPLNATFPVVAAKAVLAGDSLTLSDVRIESTNGGSLVVTGGVQLGRLTDPRLNMKLEARRFRAMDIRNFLKLTASGDLTLTGPVYGATLQGRAFASETDLYFADLVNKKLLDIDDPLFADLVDSTTDERQRLQRGAESRFLDELNVQDLQLTLGDQVWLRSAEANILLDGNLTVNKRRRIYRFDGTLNAQRGTYDLTFGPFSREFTVQRGAVRFVGSPDLNAQLDIEAQHVLRDARGQDLPVIARIQGTLYTPKVSLEAGGNARVSEGELAGYLVLGVPTSQVFGGGAPTGAAGSLLTSVLGQAISSAGLPVDISVGVGLGGTPGTGAQQQLSAGFQIGRKTYVLLNTYLCTGQAVGGTTNFGASLQYRFSKTLRVQASVDPRQQFCGNTSTLNLGYQFGADVYFEKEFH